MRFSVRQDLGRLTGRFWDWRSLAPHWVPRGAGAAAVAAGTILELSIPLADIAPDAGGPDSQHLSFFLAVYQDDVEVERHPAHRPIETASPDERFESRHWTA